MVDKIWEPSMPSFPRRAPTSNLPNTVRKMNMANNVGQDLHSTSNFSNQKTFLSHSGVSQESTDDEFSDFQSAPLPALSSGSQGNSINFQLESERELRGLSSIGSPLHLSGAAVESQVRNQASFANGNTRQAKKQSIVGCRLANYDLGFSPRVNPQQTNGNVPVIQPQIPASSTFNANFSQPSGAPGDNLLIGEEDKYSALRGLIDDGESEPSIFNVTSSQNPGCSIEHKISLVSDDVLEVVKTETTDSLDFGDFQSFSSENRYSIAHHHSGAPTTEFNHILQPATDISQPNNIMNLNMPFHTSRVSTMELLPSSSSTNNLTGLSVLPVVNTDQHDISAFGDAEFGDFVSCGKADNFSLYEPNTMGSTSPALAGKTETNNKKSTAAVSSSKAKKPSHSVGKISMTRIAKASNILTDSPTFPKPETASSINDRSLFYEASSILKEPTSFPTLVDDFDFNIPSNPDDTVGADPLTRMGTLEFGAPLKTTLIGNSTEVDDFGDFTGVQVPAVESASKVNSLGWDLLPLTKSQCPAETLSLASLDLGSYLETDEGKVGAEHEISPDSSSNIDFDSYAKDDLSDSKTPDPISPAMLAEKCFTTSALEIQPYSTSAETDDKYKCFKDEIENERERCTTEWNRCLTSCLNLLSYAQNIFNSISSSEVRREVVSNEKGYAYILNLIEVFLVAGRIYRSWSKLGGGMKVKQLYDEIISTWESFTPFFEGTSVMENISQVDDYCKHRNYDNHSHGDNVKVCGVCLINASEENHETLLDYGGKYYHSTCANLWINEVDSILPCYCFSTCDFPI